jgi:hypothetical protein
MSVRSLKEIPGIEFFVDARGRRKSVVIDLGRHRALWEDLFDAYFAQHRRNEPRESLSKVKKLVPVRAQAGVARWKAPPTSGAFVSGITGLIPQSTTERGPSMLVG